MPFVSAGVYSTEVDLSLYAETVTQTVFGVVGCFNKGDIKTEIEVSNIDKLIAKFGKPISPGQDGSNYLLPQAWYAGREFLRRGNRLKVVRAESSLNPALYAAASLPGGSEDTVATGVDGATSIPSSRTLTSSGANFVSAGVKVGDVLHVHDLSSPGDNGYYRITNVTSTVLTVDRNWPEGSLTSLDYTVWSGKVEGGSDGATGVSSGRTFTSAGSTFTTNLVSAGMILKIHDVSTPGDNGVYVITSVDSETQIKVNRDFPVGSLSNLDFTIYGPIQRGTDGSTAVAGTFSSMTAKFAEHGVKAGDILYIKDSVDSGANGYYIITAAGTTTLTIAYNRSWPASLTNLDFEVWPGSIMLTPLSKGTWLTGYKAKTSRNSGNTTNVNIEIWDPTGVFLQERIYDCNRANVITNDDASTYFSATVIANRTEPVAGAWAVSTLTPARQEMFFSGGDDGTTGITDADYLMALAVLKNPEKTQLNLIAVPGQTSQALGDGLVAFAEQRADCLALVDPPDWGTLDSVQDVLNWHNGTLVRTTAFNTSYGTLMWAWQQVYDEFNGMDVWTAPSGHVAAQMAYTDNIAYPWFAPAGFKRGLLIGSKACRYSPDQGERDAMQNGTQCVNPIVNFVGVGIAIFGQKTLLRSNSALNRVNVRRMLLQVETAIAGACRYLVFDPNDDALFRELEQIVDPVLTQVLTQRGVREWKLVNATSTADQENSTLRGRIFIKPMKAAETIVLEYVLTPQGANFEELIAV